MQNAGAAFMLDSCTIFWRMLRVTGWFARPADILKGMKIVGGGVRAGEIIGVGQPHCGVDSALGPGKGFSVEILFETEAPDPRTLLLVFETEGGASIEVRLVDLIDERQSMDAPAALHNRFYDLLRANPDANVLDVGGRARSGRDRSTELPGKRAVVVDILDAPNVDVVGDAHRLSTLFQHGSFDAFMSVAVFEHLAMPWKVAVELNRVLRMGGIGFALSHQTLGMHDIPWDFWRYSDQAWHSVFNRFTGFEVIETALGSESYIIPHFWRPDKRHSELAVGFEVSTVLVRKVGDARLDWDLGTADLLESQYPFGTTPTTLNC